MTLLKNMKKKNLLFIFSSFEHFCNDCFEMNNSSFFFKWTFFLLLQHELFLMSFWKHAFLENVDKDAILLQFLSFLVHFKDYIIFNPKILSFLIEKSKMRFKILFNSSSISIFEPSPSFFTLIQLCHRKRTFWTQTCLFVY